ncbi:MAG TPA: glycine radical domain-containing protein, partial [Armatimonadota bacterium]|nr:glycine radical domain-containing protein [Armatimonadota bacterium]
ALLNSVLKLRPAEYWQGGYNLNLTLSPNTVSDKNLLALVDAFFADGGQELQIGCLDADTLRDAKANPEKYPDLLVRIAGFNALFAKLSPAEQDELIARAEGRQA